VAQNLEDVFCDLGDLLAGVHDGEYSPFFVVLLYRLGLLTVSLKLSPDSLLRVIVALHERAGILALHRVWGRVVVEVVHPAGGQRVPPTAGDPLDQLLVAGPFEHDHVV
jgi:hypothetical protein